MKFFKSLYLILLFIPIFTLSSCGGSTEDPYKGKIKDDDSLKLVLSQNTFDITNENEKKLDPLKFFTVTLNGNPVEYSKSDESDPPVGKYFVTTSNVTPTTSRIIDKSLNLQSSEESREVDIYVGLITEDKSTLYVSKVQKITVKNPKALKTWVKWVFGFGVIIIAAAIIAFARKYKEKHP